MEGNWVSKKIIIVEWSRKLKLFLNKSNDPKIKLAWIYRNKKTKVIKQEDKNDVLNLVKKIKSKTKRKTYQ